MGPTSNYLKECLQEISCVSRLAYVIKGANRVTISGSCLSVCHLLSSWPHRNGAQMVLPMKYWKTSWQQFLPTLPEASEEGNLKFKSNPRHDCNLVYTEDTESIWRNSFYLFECLSIIICYVGADRNITSTCTGLKLLLA